MDLLLNIMYVLYTVFSTYLGAQIFFVQRERWRIDFLCILGKGFILIYSGLLIFREKKSKISRDFQGQIRGKIGRFRGILAEKSHISKDSQGQILRKIGRFHGKFRGGNFAKKQSVKNSRFRWIFFGKFR